MTYEAYENRMLKIARVLNFIRKYRVLILSVLGAFLALLVAFCSTKGMITSDVVASDTEYVYGEEYEFSAKALFSKVDFEYTKKGEDNWTKEAPILPGVYSARAVSRRSFGIKGYGEVFEIEIKPKEVTVNVSAKAVYGEAPTITVELVSGDTVTYFDYEYDDPYSIETTVRLKTDSFKVFANSGIDVSRGYSFSASDASIEFTPKPLTVTFESAEKVYDGTPLILENYGLSDELVEGDRFVAGKLAYASITNVGECENINTDLKFFNSKGEDVTDMYSLSVTPGTLKVIPREITVTTASAEKVYDGEPLLKEEWTKSGELEFVSGHIPTAEFYESITDVGSVDNAVMITVFDADGRDVSENYSLNYEPGTLTVTQRPMLVNAGSGSWVYDGLEHTGTALDTAYFVSDEDSLVQGHLISELVTSGTITFVGECDNIIESLEIYDSNHTRVTKNYELTFAKGKLSVTPRRITVTTQSYSVEYDGQEHGADGYYLIECAVSGENPFAYGDRFEFEFINAKNVWDTVDGNNKMIVSALRGFDDVSENYDITYNYGTVTVTPRQITVTAEDYSWEYDGILHTAKELPESANARITLGSLVFGHTISVVTNGSVKNANDGPDDIKAVHSVEKCTVFDENQNDVSKNYSISFVSGSFTVTKRPIEIILSNGRWTYDGLTHTPYDIAERYSVIYTGAFGTEAIAPGETLTVVSLGSVTDVNSRPGGILVDHYSDSWTITDSEGVDTTANYDIQVVNGTLVVEPRPITVTVSRAELVYDGYYHTIEELIAPYTVALNLDMYDGNPEDPVLVLDHIISQIEYTADPLRNVATVGVGVSYLTISDSLGTDKTENYDLTFVDGELKINPRRITVATGTKTVIYDGNALSLETASIISGSLADNEWIDFYNYASIVDYGEITNSVSYEIYDAENSPTTTNYDIYKAFGTLTVNRRPITLVMADFEWVYDGEYHDGGDIAVPYYVMGDYDLVLGHSLAFEWSEGLIDVGTASNNPVHSYVYDSFGSDVTGNYDLTVNAGTLEVTKRPITVITSDLIRTYTGAIITDTAENVSIVYGTPLQQDFSKDAVVYADDYYFEFYGDVINVWDSGKDNAALIYITRDGENVNGNYDISYVYGKITVNKCPISIVSQNRTWEYDGRTHNAAELVGDNVIVNGMVVGHTATVQTVSADILNAYEEAEHSIKTDSVKILDSNGNDVTGNYEIAFENGVLRIEQRRISVSMGSGQWVYDGKLHKGSDLEEVFSVAYAGYTQGAVALADGHTAHLTSVGEIINFGTEDHEYTDFYILDANLNDVTDNYVVISQSLGVLEILKKEITVVTQDAKKIYDGTKLFNDYVEVKDDILPEGQTLLAISHASITDFGEKPNAVLVDVMAGTDIVTDNYIISYEYGTLTIDKRPIVVITVDMEKTYDGLPVVCDDSRVEIFYGDAESIDEGKEAIVYGDSVGYNFVELINVADTKEGNSVVYLSVLRGETPVTANYDITYIYGTVTIKPCEVTVSPLDFSWVYDGKAHSANDKKSNAQVIFGNAVSTHTFRTYSEESIVEVGEILYFVTDVKAFDAYGAEVTGNYTITYSPLYGKLTVTANSGGEENEDEEGDGVEFGESLGSSDLKLGLTDTRDTDGDGKPDDESFESFEIYADFTGNILLYSGHYTDYLGTDWAGARSDEAPDSFYLVARALMARAIEAGISPNEIEIFLYGNTPYLIPYYADPAMVDNTQTWYNIAAYSYLFGTDTQPELPDEWVAFEEAYREYAHTIYTALPTETKIAMMEIIANKLPTHQSMSVLDKILWVEDYVKNVAPYDYGFVVPQGVTDIAVWFLTDPEASGVCSHFATAAAVMYRALGIPARVVSGFSANTVAEEYVDVFSDRAHAWVEVYVDGLGWITVDPTGSLNPDDSTDSKKIIITSDSYEKFFDGTSISCEGYQVLGELQAGHYLEVVFEDTSEYVNIGQYENRFTARVVDEYGNEVEGVYNLEIHYGILRIRQEGTIILSPYEIHLSYTGATRYYESEYPDENNRVWVVEGQDLLPEGYTIKANVIGSADNPMQQVWSEIVQYWIYDKYGNDVTSQYADCIVTETAVFEINRIALVIETESTSSQFTFTPVTKNEYAITLGQIWEGHVFKAKVTGSGIWPGTYDNTIEVSIVDSEGNDVMGYYDITYNLGKITIYE